jgi:hypothetical protein
MPINQPPISQDPVAATWDLEVTQSVNDLEERFRTLLQAIIEAEDLDDLQNRIQGL